MTFRRTIEGILLALLILQTGCSPKVEQAKTATLAGAAQESPTPPQPSATVQATLVTLPGATVTMGLPTLAATGTPLSEATGVPKAQQGIGFGAFLDVDSPDGGLELLKAAGGTWVHIPFLWSTVEPQPGDRKWGAVLSTEKTLRAAAENKMNSILYINDTPGWALKAGYTCGAVAQNQFGAMAAFFTDLVKRYSAAPFNIMYYELWSEPEASGFLGCWGDKSDLNYDGGGYYAEMLKVAYPAIKAANPQAQVLFGGLLLDCNPDVAGYCSSAVNQSMGRFFEGAARNGAGPYFDGISFHAYDYYQGALGQYSNANWGAAWNTTGPVILVKAAYLRGILAKYGISDKYLMNTELALLCGRTGQEAVCTSDEHARTLGAYIVQSSASGIANGLLTIIWFSLAGWRGSGLLDVQLKPLQAYTAFQLASAKLSHAIYVNSITDFSGVSGYEFTRNGSKMWVVWSGTSTNNPHKISLSTALLLQSFSMSGGSLGSSTALLVGQEPVYIEFGS